MSNITLALLAAVAIGTVSRASSKAFHTLTVEEARAEVKIKDGFRKPQTDGSQNLTVVIGKHTLPMDCIKAGTSRIAVTADQVESYTEALQELVSNGDFDDAIVKAQALAKAQYEKAVANPRKRVTKAEPLETEGLNLDSLDEESSEDQVDTDEEL